MDTNELIIRIAEALEKQLAFPQWDTIIQIFSVIAAWIIIMFLLVERKNKERPYLQVSFELVRSSLACLVIRNVGECPLEVSSIELSDEFVKQLPQKAQERVASLKKSEIKIFPKRHWVFSLDVITGTILNDYNIKKITIDYKYKKLGKCRKRFPAVITRIANWHDLALLQINAPSHIRFPCLRDNAAAGNIPRAKRFLSLAAPLG